MTALTDLDALIERLQGFNPPDRTIASQRDYSQAIHEAAAALVQLRDENARLDADHNRIGAKCDALQQKVGRMRRALRQLNKAHRVLWRVILYRNEFHDFAVKQGAFIEFRNATEKRP